MSDKIKVMANEVMASIDAFLLATITSKWAEAEKILRKELTQPARVNLWMETAYFSVDYLRRHIPASFAFDEKKELVDELHKNVVGWLLKNFFSSDKNPIGYEDKVRAVYYDTLSERNLAYQDPKNDNKEVYREILSGEFQEERLKIDKKFFDSISTEIIERLNKSTHLFSK